MFEKLETAVGCGLLRHIDLYFAQQLAELDGRSDPALSLSAALVSLRIGEGDVCLDLNDIAETELKDKARTSGYRLAIPSLQVLKKSLQTSPVVGEPGDTAPLILDQHDRLYLSRYWWFEKQVADDLLKRGQTLGEEEVDLPRLKALLTEMFPNEGVDTDWQKVATAVVMLRRFAVISGGPGTGKTYTVTGILALLLALKGDKPMRISLAAPTGKAAARLSESIRKAKASIPCSESVRANIPEEASTIHRLLGIRQGQCEPSRNIDNPLDLDLLIVDEASMIDLPMMARLLSALPEKTRLILLGDKDQLASVEAGSVFGDICGSHAAIAYTPDFRANLSSCTGQEIPVEGAGSSFLNSIALLKKSHRFSGDTGIGALAKVINAGDTDAAIRMLEDAGEQTIFHSSSINKIKPETTGKALDTYAGCLEAKTPSEALQLFSTFRILCAVRGGPSGVEQINATIEQALREKGLIRGADEHYRGRPVMVKRNDYSVDLFNGDIGILWPDPEADGQLRAWFEMSDGKMKKVLPSRLPEHETAYAMTVHKSQGSEFESILLVLPFEEVGVVTRELLYTGITRAKEKAEIWGSREIFSRAIETTLHRVTGLGDRLAGKSIHCQ